MAALREAAKSSDAEVVLRARRLLAQCRPGRAEESLSAALEWLRQTPTPQATPLLLDLLPVLPDAFQSSTRAALWVCAGPDDVPRLRRAIGDVRPAVRGAAIVALERAAGAGAVPELEPLLGDKSEATRLAAARALLDRLPRPSIAALLGLLDARQPDIRQEAAWLLLQVSGIPRADEPPPDPIVAAARWRAWAATEAAAHPRPLGLRRLQGHGDWNVTKDFSIAKGNPNGAWTYGMVKDSTFVPYKERWDDGKNQVWHGNLRFDRSPLVGVWYGPAQVGLQPGQLYLHPGPGQEPSVARWTAPAGVGLRVHVQGRFLPGAWGGKEVGIFVKGIPGVNEPRWHSTIRPGQLNDEASGPLRFDLLLDVSPGDTVDFAVYRGFMAGATPLEAAITSVAESWGLWEIPQKPKPGTKPEIPSH